MKKVLILLNFLRKNNFFFIIFFIINCYPPDKRISSNLYCFEGRDKKGNFIRSMKLAFNKIDISSSEIFYRTCNFPSNSSCPLCEGYYFDFNNLNRSFVNTSLCVGSREYIYKLIMLKRKKYKVKSKEYIIYKFYQYRKPPSQNHVFYFSKEFGVIIYDAFSIYYKTTNNNSIINEITNLIQGDTLFSNNQEITKLIQRF